MTYIRAQRLIALVIVTCFLLLGTVSILSIWEVIENEDLLWKSLTTSLVIGMVGAVILGCLKYLEDRERALQGK